MFQKSNPRWTAFWRHLGFFRGRSNELLLRDILPLLIDESPDAIFARGKDRKILSWNKGAEQLFGYSAKEAVGRTAIELGFTTLTPEDILAVERSLLQTGKWQSEVWYRHRDGRQIFGAVTANAIKDNFGDFLYIVFIIRDITTRKKLEDELYRLNAALEEKVEQRTQDIYRNELMLRSLFEHSEEAISVTSREFQPLFRSPAFLRLLGNISIRELPSFAHPEDLEAMSNARQTMLQNPGLTIPFEGRFRGISGDYIWMEGTLTNLLHVAGVEGVVANVRDITLRKRATEKLVASEEHYRMLVEQLVDGLFLSDALGNYLDVNQAGCEMLGYTHAEITSMSIPDIVIGEEIARIPTEAQRLAGGGIAISEWHFRRKDGSIFLGEVIGRALPDGRLQAILRDVTAQRQMETDRKREYIEKLQLADRLTRILDSMQTSIALLDAKGRIVEVNAWWRRFAKDNGLKDTDDGIGWNYLQVALNATGEAASDGRLVAEGISRVISGKSPEFTYEYASHSPAEQRWFRMIVIPLSSNGDGAVVMHHDISTLRRLEQEKIRRLLDEEKIIAGAMLEAQEAERNFIGAELHDNIGQLLVGTLMTLSIVNKDPAENKQEIRRAIQLIHQTVDITRKMAHHLVAPDFSVAPFTDLLQSLAAEMLGKAAIETQWDLEYFDESQLTDNHKLTIYRVAQEQCTNILKHAEARNVQFTLFIAQQICTMFIADDGLGMKKEKGNGIGLRNIRGRLIALGGMLQILTEEGAGFSLRISFPLV